jgi:hypothetical protein
MGRNRYLTSNKLIFWELANFFGTNKFQLGFHRKDNGNRKLNTKLIV